MPVSGKGSYDFYHPGGSTGLEEVEFEDDLAEKQIAQGEAGLIQKVVDGFDDFFGHSTTPKSQNAGPVPRIEETKEAFQQSGAAQAEAKKEELRQAMGDDVFHFYFDFLYKNMVDPSADKAKLRSELNQMIGSNRQLKNLIFEMEQLIFREI